MDFRKSTMTLTQLIRRRRAPGLRGLSPCESSRQQSVPSMRTVVTPSALVVKSAHALGCTQPATPCVAGYLCSAGACATSCVDNNSCDVGNAYFCDTTVTSPGTCHL
jgi:hypothetical protein